MKAIIVLIAFLLFLLYLPSVKSVSAAFSFNIASVSATTISSGGQEIDVNLSITSLPSGDSYFRAALQKESGSYFGYVKDNNGNWAAIQTLSGDCTIYYKINDTSTTSLTLKFKMGDDASIDNGDYKLKAHRFTSTCKSYTEATNNSTATVSVPTPAPTSTPTPTSTPSPTATPTPTKTPTPIPNTPTSKPSLMPLPSSILGESTQSGEIISPTDVSLNENILISNKPKNTNNSWFQKIFMIVGIVFIASCAILAFREIRKKKLIQNE